MRQAERRAVRNQAARSAVRTFVKKAAEAVSGSGEDAVAVVRQAVRALDKAAQKGIIHRNAAARRKSRLMSRVHQLSTAAPQPARAETKARGTRAAGTTTRRTTTTSRTTAAEKKPAATTTTRRPAARKTAPKE